MGTVLKDTPAIADLRSTLHQVYRVSITDSRFFMGTFACIDKELNMVLVNADEYRLEDGQYVGRYVGMIMVPWQYVVTAEVQLSTGTEDEYT